MGNIKFNCPKCEKVLQTDASIAGQEVECPSCNTSFTAPPIVPPPQSHTNTSAIPGNVDNTELAKQLSKAALKSGMDVISGKKETSILKWAVMGFRVLGVALFVMSIFKLWIFEYMSITTGWTKTVCTGLISGFIVYCNGELINLLINIENHLRKISNK